MRLLSRLPFLALLTHLLGPPSSAQVLVELKDGSSLTGEAIEERNDSLFVRSEEGPIVGVDGDAIRYLGPVGKSSGIASYYPIYGLTAGTPGLLNLTGGFYMPFLTFRVGGSPMSLVSGVQFDLGYPFVQTANLTVDLYGCYGLSDFGDLDDHREREYVGLGGSFRFYVLFVSLGARYDLIGEDISPLAQIGAIIEVTQ